MPNGITHENVTSLVLSNPIASEVLSSLKMIHGNIQLAIMRSQETSNTQTDTATENAESAQLETVNES